MKHGILVISHGSREQAWVEQVDTLVARAAASYKEYQQNEKQDVTPIYAAYFEIVEGRLIQDGITALEHEGVTHIHVMPLFVSHGSSHVEEIKQAFGFEPVSSFIGDLEPFEKHAEVTFHEPIVDDAEVVAIIREQAESMSTDKSKEAVLVLGHGSSYDYFFALWEQDMKQLVEKLRAASSFAHIDYAPLLPEKSRERLEQLQALPQVERVLVVPLFLSPGYFTTKVIPTRLSGLNYEYTGETLLPHREMEKLLLNRFVQIGSSKA